MQYLTVLGYANNPKNNLQKDIAEYLKSKERIVVSEHSVECFQKMILDKIDELNKKHSRCKPIEAKWRERNTRGDLTLGDYAYSHFYLYASVLEFKTPEEMEDLEHRANAVAISFGSG